MFHSHRKMMDPEAPEIPCNVGIFGVFFVLMQKKYFIRNIWFSYTENEVMIILQ